MFELLRHKLPDRQKELYRDENFSLLGDKENVIIVSAGNPDFALTWGEQLELSAMILGDMHDTVFRDCEDCQGIAINTDLLSQRLEPVLKNESQTLSVSASLEGAVFCNAAEIELQLCWHCVNNLGNFLIEIDSRFRN